MRTPQDILENMEEEINRLRAELNNSKNFHCPHYLTNDSGGVSCHRDFEKEIASLKEIIVQAVPYVEYAVRYSTPLSQKRSEEWLEKVQTRREE